MTTRKIKKEVNHSGASVSKVSSVILDVDKYKDFVPHCSSSKILEKGDGFLLAEITISFSVFKVSYISEISFTIKEKSAKITVKERGNKVFKKLLNVWNIEAIDEQKLVIDFFVDFEIKNPILNTLAKASMPIVSDIILNAFIKRAKEK